MVTGGTPHDDKVLGVLSILGVNQVDNLIVDDACIGVIDGTVTTDEHLRSLISIVVLVSLQQFTELGVRVNNVGDTLGRIESGNLDNVVTFRPLELGHLLLDAKAAEFSHIETRIPRLHLFVKSVEPGNDGRS